MILANKHRNKDSSLSPRKPKPFVVGKPLVIKSRSWCFTAFNYDQDLLRNLEEIDCKVLACQQEVCPLTQRDHIQGMIDFEHPVTKPTVQKRLGQPGVMHVEPTLKTLASIRYCTDSKKRKPGTKEILRGVFPGTPKHKSLHDAIEFCKVAESWREVCEAFPLECVRHERSLRNLRYQAQEREARGKFRRMEVIVLYGKTGVGKTRYVRLHHPHAYSPLSADKLWWDGYDLEDTIFLDEFTGQLPYQSLLRLTDGHHTLIEGKGTVTFANWHRVYICSSKHPFDWYPMRKECEELKRRITAFIEIEKGDEDKEIHRRVRAMCEPLLTLGNTMDPLDIDNENVPGEILGTNLTTPITRPTTPPTDPSCPTRDQESPGESRGVP
ncbi:replication-associated protein [Blackfly DNA Virus 17]|nr:replication-associated protein [Blackfly DNA Virus 17]